MADSKIPVVLGITGASGAIYAIEIVKILTTLMVPVEVVLTEQGRRVMFYETGRSWEEWCGRLDKEREFLATFSLDELHQAPASGSHLTRGMVVAPCSMGTLGRIAGGISSNLLERAADVTLKERRTLILLARETPLNRIHLKNMLTLTDAGAVIFPPVPAFYLRPDSIETMAGHTASRLLSLLNIESDTFPRWDGKMDIP